MTFPDVYLYDFSNDTHSVDELRQLLGEQRYEYCRQMKSAKAGLSSAFAFLLLRYALKKHSGITEIPELVIGEHGKPYLKDYPEIFFNMSHSDTRVICAVSDSPVGVDIQDIRKITPSAAKKFLTDEELKSCDLSDISGLCRIWCIKESYGKLTGKGFAEGFGSFSAGSLISDGRARCIERDGFFISICIREVIM